MTIYAGTSAFFANRSTPNDHHNWLVNNKRPMLSLITTAKDGTKSYNDLFVNTDVAEIKVAKNGKVTITFDSNISKPLFRRMDKDNAPRVDKAGNPF